MSGPNRDYDDQLSKALYDLRDWVYVNYQLAFIVGTAALAYSLTFPNLIAFIVLWLAILALGLGLDPCVNPNNLRYGWGLLRGSADLGMTVALTFDDGPGEDTEALLAILREHDVKATFFNIGAQAQLHPEIVKKVQEDGHVIGNHTQNHHSLLTANRAQAWSEISQAQDVLHGILGKSPQLFRHPYGFRAPWTQSQLDKAGVKAIFWSVNPRDFQNPGSKEIVSRVLKEIGPGAIVLLHDGPGSRAQTLDAVKRLIPALKKLGYRFLTIDEMLPA